MCFALSRMTATGRWITLLCLCTLTAGCSVIVEAELANRTEDGGTDAGPMGETCMTDEQCISFDPFNCNRVCGAAGHCVDGMAAPNGTRCGMGSMMHCVAAMCVLKACGDGFVDRMAMEYCDDGNDNPADTCDNMCTRSCVPPAPANCNDSNICNGAEVCGMGDGLCHPAPPAADGTACMVATMPGMCRSGVCIAD